MAQMMRVGLYRPVHVKTLRSQKLRMLLTHRKLLQSKAIAIENDLRGTLRNFGLKVGVAGAVRFEAHISANDQCPRLMGPGRADRWTGDNAGFMRCTTEGEPVSLAAHPQGDPKRFVLVGSAVDH
jgi:hypothetical protein